MSQDFPTKELIIAVVEKNDAILMRKKPDGSPPYKETWYIFGCEPKPDQNNEDVIKDYLKSELGIDVEVENKIIDPDTEIKADHDGVTKTFIYRNLLCKYLSGEPKVPVGAEKVAWIPKAELSDYDLVPPSRKLLRKLGYVIADITY